MWDWVTPQDYGAVGDGATDDTNAFQNALNSGYPVWVPQTHPASNGYYIQGTLVFNGGTKNGWQIPAGEPGATLRSDNGTAILSIASQYVEVSGLTFYMGGLPEGHALPFPKGPAGSNSTAILLNNTSNSIAFLRFRDLLFDNCHSAIKDQGSTNLSNYVTDMQVLNCKCWRVYAGQISLTNTKGSILFRDFQIDLSQNNISTDPNSPATPSNTIFALFGPYQLDGLELERFDVNGGITAMPATLDWALQIYGSSSAIALTVYLTRVLIDSFPGGGISLQYVQNLFAKDTFVYSALGAGSPSNPGIYLNNVTDAVFTNTYVLGSASQPAFTSGISINNCQNIDFANVLSWSNTGNGIWIRV